MYRKALVNGEFLYFVHAPPQTDLDVRPEAGRPAPPDPNQPKLYASVYYYWWAFLRLNGDYLACCERLGKGSMAKIYRSFGDIRDGQRPSTDQGAKPGEIDEFREWWIERGAKLFAEPQAKELLLTFDELPQHHDMRRRVLLSVPLSGNIDVTLHAIGRQLRPRFREFQARHGHYSRAKFKPEDGSTLKSLDRILKIARAYTESERTGEHYKQWTLADKAGIGDKLEKSAREGDDLVQIKGRVVSLALQQATRLIANVGEGRFPDFSDPEPGQFVFFKPRSKAKNKDERE